MEYLIRAKCKNENIHRYNKVSYTILFNDYHLVLIINVTLPRKGLSGYQGIFWKLYMHKSIWIISRKHTFLCVQMYQIVEYIQLYSLRKLESPRQTRIKLWAAWMSMVTLLPTVLTDITVPEGFLRTCYPRSTLASWKHKSVKGQIPAWPCLWIILELGMLSNLLSLCFLICDKWRHWCVSCLSLRDPGRFNWDNRRKSTL